MERREKFKVEFDIKFVKGNLKGIEIPDMLFFPTEKSAYRWANDVKGKHIDGKIYKNLQVVTL